MNKLRGYLYRQLEPTAWHKRGLSPLNWAVVATISLATLLAILRTEPVVVAGREELFAKAEFFLGMFFLLEYLARSLSVGVSSQFSGWRVTRYLLTPGALLDLFVVIVSLAPVLAGNLFPLRLLRILGIIRFAKLGRFSQATRHLSAAIFDRRYELLLTMMFAFALVIIGATGMWLVEGDVQPDQFGSIPRAIWWAAITLTTIGYGDAYPITVMGKAIAIMVAVAGIGLIAMPAGILASAFSEALVRSRNI
jgi:voltage-gated potassium channel